jgi:hypothetical protein
MFLRAGLLAQFQIHTLAHYQVILGIERNADLASDRKWLRYFIYSL